MRSTRAIGFAALRAFFWIALAAGLPSHAQKPSQPFFVQSKVVDPSGSPVPGATGSLDPDDCGGAPATTNENRHFELKVAPPNKQVFPVLAPWFPVQPN